MQEPDLKPNELNFIRQFIALQRLFKRGLSAQLRMGEIFKQLAAELMQWFELDTVILGLLSADGKHFIRHFFEGQAGFVGPEYLEPDNTIYGLALAGNESVNEFDQAERCYRLVVPLGGLSSLGVLAFSRRQRPFTALEATQAQFITESLALSLDNQRLLEEVAQAEAVKEANRLKMQLLTSVSHELRTPLGLIRGYLTTLDEKFPQISQAEQREFVHIALDETETLTVLVENLLDMARLESTRDEWQPQKIYPTRPDEIINVAVRNFVATGRALSLQLEPNLPKISVDAMQIVQAIRNLLDNALRYTPAPTPVALGTYREGPWLVIKVADQGPGIEPEALTHIFEKFYRVNPGDNHRVKGLGLGLAISKSIVEAQGGQIWAESEAGRGTSFFIRLPLDVAEAKPGETTARKEGVKA